MFEEIVNSLKKLIEKVKRFLSSSKKFVVEREETIRFPPPSPHNIGVTPSNDDIYNSPNSEGRFRIDGEQQIERPTAIHPVGQSNSESNSRLRVEAVTRPKQCRVCRTENKITRLPSNQWKCTECGHTWN